MKPILKDFWLGATALAAIVMLVGASPNFVAFAQTTPPPAATSVALTEPTIKALQEALNKQGIVVKVGGALNDETRAAIRKYQSQHHLPVTGEPDKATLDKLGVANPQSAASSPAQPTPPPGQPGMGGMPMTNRMSGMPMMMNMMGSTPMMGMTGRMQMEMMGPRMAGMATIDRVEGRISFLRTELKITEAQANAWNAFADTLRTNAGKLGEVSVSMMPKPGAGQQHAPSMAERLDLQERWLLARLEGTRTIKTAFTKLYGTLSDEQKKTADEILAPHMGMGMMTMMPGATQPGQMGPGQTGPGRMQPGGR